MSCILRTLIIVFGVYLFVGCASAEKKMPETLIANAKEELSFSLDSLTPNYTIPEGCDYVRLNNTDYLYYYNRLNYSLSFYNLVTKKMSHRIFLKKQGIYPVNHIVGIEVINKDSIFLLPMYIKKLYISNWNGNIYKVYSLVSDSKLEENWKNEPAKQIDIYKDECIMGTTPLGNQNIPNQYYNISLGANFNFRSEKTAINFINYPKVYQQGTKWGFYHAQYTQCINDRGEIIVSFPLDPSVYIYDKEKKLIKIANAASNHFSNKVSPFSQSKDVETYYYNEESYERMAYDKYRKIYYRFATGGVSGKEPESSKMLYKGLFKPLYVIILDEKFNKIGEVELPKNKHYFLNQFITQKGLYISNNHPDNPERDENQLSFSCYQLVNNLP